MPDIENIWVLMPAYNEGEVIGSVILDLKKFGFSNILVVDDGSKDDTAHQARAAGAKVIRHIVNRGAGAATQTGISMAKREGWPLVALMDSDGQHLAEDILCLRTAMDEMNCDLVIGSRFLHPENKIPKSRRFFNGVGNLLTNVVCKNNYTDSQSGFRMLNRNAIEHLEFHIDGFGYCSEMIYQAEKNNLSVGEAPTRVRYSKYSMKKGQDFEMGITTAISFIWKILFR